MKINIFKTNNPFLEEPQRVSICGNIEANSSVFVADIKFGKYKFDCCGNKCGCSNIAEIRKTQYNKELDCKCSC